MNKENNKSKDKGKAKVSFRAMIIAMIIALIAFLAFGGFDLGNGDGADIDTGDKSGDISEVDESAESNSDDAVLDAYTIYVREDKILILSDVSEDGYEEVTLDYIKEVLATLSSDQRVMIYDDGAINKTYEDVVTVVDESNLRKIEEKVTE